MDLVTVGINRDFYPKNDIPTTPSLDLPWKDYCGSFVALLVPDELDMKKNMFFFM